MRAVLATFGSLGDLHPYLALGLELKARGHQVTIAAPTNHRERIVSAGLEFARLRPDAPDWASQPELMARVTDLRKGQEVVVRELLMPALRQQYEDLSAACDGADFLVSHALIFAASLVAAKHQLPWISTVLGPSLYLSAFDPPVMAQAPFLARLRRLGPRLHRPLFRLILTALRSWSAPWHALRAELGLDPTPHDPLFTARSSKLLDLALFSETFATKQPDWPPAAEVTGFPFFDQGGGEELPAALREFIDQGPAPLVFTVASAAGGAETFFQHSLEAATAMGQRAILLTGGADRQRPGRLPPSAIAIDYAPFHQLFPKASVIVHQGGVGTTALAMRSGRPSLILPSTQDQPDNAARAARLGIARVLSPAKYSPQRARVELSRLQKDSRYMARAREVAQRLSQENGSVAACDAIERALQRKAP